jgi:HD-like signal output (HDOD) protein
MLTCSIVGCGCARREPTGFGRLEDKMALKLKNFPMKTLTSSDETKRGPAVSAPWAHLRLPPFPLVAVRVLQLTNDENVQLHQLSELISSDAAFASEVLTIANSLVYAPRFPAHTILQAIAVLGANHLQGMCLTVGVRTYLGKSLNHPLIRNVWRHNLACALIARDLATAGFMDQDTAYTSGVLHDVGRLALAVIRPAEYASLLEKHQGSGASILPLESELFGCDHCQAGKHLIGDWKLPSEFDAIVSDHHVPRRMEGAWSMGELIKISCKMADAAGFPAFQGCEVTPFSDLQNELPAKERGTFQADLESLAREVSERINLLESL